MAYTPYEWTVNSYLNPTRMNAIEQGIAAASQAAESASGEFHTIEELIGTQSIAGIGDGTLTGATWKINNDLTELSGVVTTLNSNLTAKDITSTCTFGSGVSGKISKIGDIIICDITIAEGTTKSGTDVLVTNLPPCKTGARQVYSNGKRMRFDGDTLMMWYDSITNSGISVTLC